MDFLTKQFVNKLVSSNLIKKEDIEIYSYGFKEMLFIILNLITTLVIGILFNKILEIIVFMITYISIRIYAGGYHARTKLKCYIFSVLMLIIVCYILKTELLNNRLLIIISTIIASYIILSLAPVEDENKPLDKIEIKVYTKKTIRNFIIILICLLLTLMFNKINFSFCIGISLLSNAAMLIIGKINNLLIYKRSK